MIDSIWFRDQAEVMNDGEKRTLKSTPSLSTTCINLFSVTPEDIFAWYFNKLYSVKPRIILYLIVFIRTYLHPICNFLIY